MALDPYEQLGVPRNASADEIKRAYRSKVQAMHPDKHPDDPFATTRFQQIQESYDILSDAARRRAYDDTGETDQADLMRRATALLTMVFDALLEETVPDLLGAARGELGHVTEQATHSSGQSQHKIARLEKQLRRYRYRGNGQDLVTDLLNNKLEKQRALLKKATQAIEESAIALVLLKDYEAVAEAGDLVLPGVVRYVTYHVGGFASGSSSTS